MPTLKEQIAEKLKLFQAKDNLDALSDASRLVESMPIGESLPAAERKDARTAKMQSRIAVLNAVDAKLIFDFDFKIKPQMSVSPPPESGVPAGADPSAIKDPKKQEKYLKDVQRNQQMAARFLFQRRLHKLNKEITGVITAGTAKDYAVSPDDTSELNGLIEEQVKNANRKASLRAFIQAREKDLATDGKSG